MKLAHFLNAFKRDENGVTGLEYAILAAVVVGVLATQKTVIAGVFTSAFAKVTTAISGT